MPTKLTGKYLLRLQTHRKFQSIIKSEWRLMLSLLHLTHFQQFFLLFYQFECLEIQC